MKRKTLIAALGALTLTGALLYFHAGHEVPAGQPPLADLTAQNFGTIRDAFNGAKDDVRVLLLLSPT